jgi:hypothetical protein
MFFFLVEAQQEQRNDVCVLVLIPELLPVSFHAI